MQINQYKLAKDMLEYMESVECRNLYREDTNMYRLHDQAVQYIQNEWKEILEDYLEQHGN